MNNPAVLAERYLHAIERGDRFAHTPGLELAEAVRAASEAADKVARCRPIRLSLHGGSGPSLAMVLADCS